MAIELSDVQERREYFERYLLSRILIRPDDCWVWQKATNDVGYGHFRLRGKDGLSHRLSYFLYHGSIPDKHDVDHLCRNRLCCNPDHLEATTRRENLLRGLTNPAAHAAKTHCPKGHPYSEENTMLSRGSRVCRECGRNSCQSRYQRHKALGGTPKQWNSGTRYK